MKKLALLGLIALSACAEINQTGVFGEDTVAREVNVLGRNWTVWQGVEDPAQIKAERDNNNLNPYGQPATTRTRQAVQAMESATGCSVVRASIYQNDMGQFYAKVTCPTRPQAAPQG